MSEYTGPEALSWLTNNKARTALAGNRFQTTADAIEAVKRLYAAGAERVRITPPLEEPERIQKYGGPYADGLEIIFSKEKTKDVLTVVRSLQPDAGGKVKDVIKVDERNRMLILWWD